LNMPAGGQITRKFPEDFPELTRSKLDALLPAVLSKAFKGLSKPLQSCPRPLDDRVDGQHRRSDT
jgi:hypothetical protein